MAKSAAKKARKEKALETIAAPKKAPKTPEAEPIDNTRLVWLGEPLDEEWSTASCKHWVTQCGRYRATMVNSRLNKEQGPYYGAQFNAGGRWDSTAGDPKQGPGYPRHYRSLNAAMEAAEAYYQAKTSPAEFTSNRDSIVDKAAGLGLAGNRTSETNKTEAKETNVKVKESSVREMFAEMGINTEKWNEKKLLARVCKLEALSQDPEVKAPTGGNLTLFRRLTKAVSEQVDISFGEAKAHANGEANGTPRKPREKKEGTKMSALDAAAQVLAKAKGGMSCQAMIDEMATKGLWSSPGGKTPAATLYSAILRELKTKGKETRFSKSDRGQFEYAGK